MGLETQLLCVIRATTSPTGREGCVECLVRSLMTSTTAPLEARCVDDINS